MAIEQIRLRLLRATSVLNSAGIPYAVVGGNAVAEWVGRVDSGAVRFTKDVDILLNRNDLPRAIVAMESAGFVYNETMGVHMFLDGPDSTPRDAVHLIFAEEKVREEYEYTAPAVDAAEQASEFQVVSLDALVQMKLMSYRDKDKTHLRDMLDVGLVDATWPARLPPLLAERLLNLLDNPE